MRTFSFCGNYPTFPDPKTPYEAKKILWSKVFLNIDSVGSKPWRNSKSILEHYLLYLGSVVPIGPDWIAAIQFISFSIYQNHIFKQIFWFRIQDFRKTDPTNIPGLERKTPTHFGDSLNLNHFKALKTMTPVLNSWLYMK